MESFLVDLKKDVQCSLCNDTLTEPKILPCFHIFCKPCVKRHAELIDDVNVFNCPRCKSQTPLPERSSVEDLQPSLIHSRILKGLALIEGEKVCSVSDSHSSASWNCFDCDRSMCDECQKCHSEFIKDHKVLLLADLKKEDIELVIARENPCTSHPQHRLELFCEDCDVLICRTCWIQDHKDHKTMSLDKFAKIKKAEFETQLQMLEQLGQDDKAKQQQENIAKTIQEQGRNAKEGVKNTAKKLMQVLQENERELLKQIDEKLNTATTNLNIIHHIPVVKEHLQNMMERGLASELMSNQEAKCSEKFIFNPIPPSSGIAYIPNQQLVQQVNTGLGEIQMNFKTDYTMGTIVVEDEPQDEDDARTEQEEDRKLELQEMRVTGRFDVSRENFIDPLYGIAVNTHNSKITVAGSKCERRYDLKYKCNRTMFDNSVCVFDGNGLYSGLLRKIPGSDHPEPWFAYGTPNPMAFLNDSDLVLTCEDDRTIRIVNIITGGLMKIFRYKSIPSDEFCHPCGVHVDDAGKIIVCDRDNRLVQVFTRDGDQQYQFGLSTQGVFDPVHVITHCGRFYVSDQYNHVIHVFEEKGNVPTRISTIGGYGSADGQLNEPWGLAIDNDNHLLVCDRGNNRVQKFTLDGRVVGKTVDEINRPLHIAVLKDGHKLVTSGTHVLYVK